MSTLTFKSQPYIVESDETILTCLMRHGIDYPNSCRAGICQSCLIKSRNGLIQHSWQEGLPEPLKAQGYFLACMARPTSSLDLEPPDTAECDINATITNIARLNYNVLKINLAIDNPGDWTPGQYLNLINSEEITRSYSIANIPSQDNYIELHIKTVENGAMSQWLQNTATINTQVRLRGPFGRCFYYNPHKLSFNMLLAGTGTGLAPLLGIIKSALCQGHKGNVTLVHGGCIDEDIYYSEELETLDAIFNNFHYDPCVLNSQGRYPEALIDQRILTHIHNPNNLQVYICGPKEITNKLKTNVFLAGVPSRSIFSDTFL